MITRPYHTTVLELLRRVSSREELRHVSHLLVDTKIPFEPDAINALIEEFQRQAAVLGLEDTLGVVAALRAQAIQIHLLITGWPNSSFDSRCRHSIVSDCCLPGIVERGVVIDLGDPRSEGSSFTIVVDITIGENADDVPENHLKKRIVDIIRQILGVPEGSEQTEWNVVVSFHHYHNE